MATNSSDPNVLARTPLYEEHVALGAKLVPFAGWEMPVKYSSDLDEHHAVRTAAGIFDISHMGEITVEGIDADAFLDYCLAGRMSALVEAQSKYTVILAPNGGVIDDLIVTLIADTPSRPAPASSLPRPSGIDERSADHSEGGGKQFSIVANASNVGAVVAALQERAKTFNGHVEVRDVSAEQALIAVQGPRSVQILEATEGLGVVDGQPPFAETKYYRQTLAAFKGVPVRVARSGYTGEDGFELMIGAGSAVALWRALIDAGGPLGLIPAGLAARDTLRLEAGMPLYGHELNLDVQPVQAGIGRVVVTDKDDFVGKAAILAGPGPDAPVLVGLASQGRRAGRAGYPVTDSGGNVVGQVTSGVLSPTLGHPIAMAFVRPDLSEPGTVLAVDVRGAQIPATVTVLPFYKRPRA